MRRFDLPITENSPEAAFIEPAHHFAPLPPEGADVAAWIRWLVEAYIGAFAGDFFYYLLAAGSTFVVLWVVLRRRLRHRRIEAEFPPRRQLRREFLWSLSTVAIFALYGVGIAYASHRGWSAIYLEFDRHGWGYWIASLAALIVLHDAYFYWTHRLMHHRRFYRFFHRVHHRSRNPSPWAAYSFAPSEAAIQGFFAPLAFFILPLHPTAILLFVLHQIFRNALGHSGFEVFPRGWQRHRALCWINTTSHHHLHHARVRGNYGLYFLWWDRLMGTEIGDSGPTFEHASGPRPALRATG
jgi:sterol desaturase/sphingolipid hydroxylase (fatty acid hydroxylase superfamily)